MRTHPSRFHRCVSPSQSRLVGENRPTELKLTQTSCISSLSAVEGVETTIPDDKASGPADKKKQKKVLRKIPPQIIKDACESACD